MRLLMLLIFTFSMPSFAVIEGYKYQFDNLEDTQRFVHLAENLRCPKCQNQNLSDSDSPVASDMRQKVYELMLEGQSNEDITQYMVDRYGDFVTYEPPFRFETVLLWFGPVLIFSFGLLLIISLRKNQNTDAAAPLSDEEKARLQALKEKADSL